MSDIIEEYSTWSPVLDGKVVTEYDIPDKQIFDEREIWLDSLKMSEANNSWSQSELACWLNSETDDTVKPGSFADTRPIKPKFAVMTNKYLVYWLDTNQPSAQHEDWPRKALVGECNKVWAQIWGE